MSTTPRTDAECGGPISGDDTWPSCYVQSDFARQLETELQELQAWKDSALQVESEWDEQAIAKMLGAKPGESCRKVIMKRVPEILAELEAFKLDGHTDTYKWAEAMAAENKQFTEQIEIMRAELEAANQDAERLAVCLQALEGDCDIGSLARRALAMHETRTN